MYPGFDVRRAAGLLAILALVAAPLAACRGAKKPGDDEASKSASRPDPASTSVPDDPRAAQFQRVDLLVSQWDAAQNEGRTEQAQALADRIRVEVDASFADFADAAAGKHGVRLQYLGVVALGYSGRPEATKLLEERLTETDGRLVGNVLIALKLRADPETQLAPILRLIPTSATEPKRYAPLALANVLEARQRAGRPRDVRLEQNAVHVLSGVVADRDPYVRLHSAKALGFLPEPGSYELLLILLKDDHIRIRVSAAASLERLGDPRGFPEVVRLLADAPDDSKPVVRDVLASYAERLQGRPLASGEVEGMGLSPNAWARWYEAHHGTRSAPAGRTAPLVQPERPPPSPPARQPAPSPSPGTTSSGTTSSGTTSSGTTSSGTTSSGTMTPARPPNPPPPPAIR